MKRSDGNGVGSSRLIRTPAEERRTAAYAARPRETLIELMTRDLEAWRLAKGVIAKVRR